MNIAHINESDSSGGAARAALRIHHALIAEGVKSDMHVARKASGDSTVIGPDGKIGKGLNMARPHLGGLLARVLSTENANIHSTSILPSKWPSRINRSARDLVHLHWVGGEMMSIKDIGRIKKPIVWTLHDMWAFCGAEHYTEDSRFQEGYTRRNRPNHEGGFDLNRWTWNRKRRGWRLPMHVVAPSRWLADCAKSSALMGNWSVSVIHNPLDTEVWSPIEKSTARRLLGLPEDGRLLAFGAMGGGKDPRKGVDLLLAALKHLCGQMPGLELIVFGERRPRDGPDVELPIHYMGHLHDDLSLRVLYSAVDAMVVPSRQEAFGQTASEANACGTPVVAFDNSGLTDIVLHRETGWLAEAFDTEDLARGIQWVLEDEERLVTLGKNARRYAEQNFAASVIADQYRALYESVLLKG